MGMDSFNGAYILGLIMNRRQINNFESLLHIWRICSGAKFCLYWVARRSWHKTYSFYLIVFKLDVINGMVTGYTTTKDLSVKGLKIVGLRGRIPKSLRNRYLSQTSWNSFWTMSNAICERSWCGTCRCIAGSCFHPQWWTFFYHQNETHPIQLWTILFHLMNMVQCNTRSFIEYNKKTFSIDS